MATLKTNARMLDRGVPQAVTITFSVAQVDLINALYEEGFSGPTCAEIARRIFCLGCIAEADRLSTKDQP